MLSRACPAGSKTAFQVISSKKGEPMDRRDLVLAIAAGLVLSALPACESADPARSGRVQLNSGAPEDRDFVGSFSDFEGNTFKAWWGPHTSTSCPVNMTVYKEEETDHSSVVPPSVDDPGSATTVLGSPTMLECGAASCAYTVYLDGTFRGWVGGPQPDSRVVTKAIYIPVWPIVYTHRIKIGATGTKFFVHIDGDRHTIGRLKGGTGTLYVNDIHDGETTETIWSSTTQDRYVVYDPASTPKISAVQTPTGGSAVAALFTEVRRRHTVHAGDYPPIEAEP